MRKLGEAFYGRGKSYEAAFAALPDAAVLAALLARTVYADAEVPSSPSLVDYILGQRAALGGQPWTACWPARSTGRRHEPGLDTPVRLHQIGRGAVSVRLEPDAAERAKVAHDLGLESLPALSAQLTLKPWFDGVEITGRFEATVEQICAVSLDNFEHPLSGDIDVRVVPAGSPQAPEGGGELEFDPEAPDPPDVLEGDAIDLAAYVVVASRAGDRSLRAKAGRRVRLHAAHRAGIALRSAQEVEGRGALTA